jgi:hypothetical protein
VERYTLQKDGTLLLLVDRGDNKRLTYVFEKSK